PSPLLPPLRKTQAVSEVQDMYEAARAEKLQRIAALGLDPWGGRFDNYQPLAEVVALPADLPEGERPRVRIAGRVVMRRVGGKLHFLDVLDWSGQPTTRRIKSKNREGQEEETEYPTLTSRVQVMVGAKQVGETGWKLAQELDLGDLIGVDGTFGKTRTG